MKIKEGFILREVAGVNMVVPLGAETIDFNGMITLNDTGMLLWKALSSETDINSLVNIILNEYEIDEKTARNDVIEFIEKLKETDILE